LGPCFQPPVGDWLTGRSSSSCSHQKYFPPTGALHVWEPDI
jgi:hypothetical protein